ncbi:unnamed protein product [Clonostachys rhizophaga]|uniref:BZIP domain-containing protein n=1 Tax=Clonostachys rhizophaga TaxID=160324 RepID=A0A9N9UWH1_9HYPO|nr:unnamed protein product [Clonostachys rhizophaga]
MSSYNGGRRGVNISQYLRDLNTISPQESNGDDNFSMGGEELTLFTNTEFYDFDSGQQTDFQAPPVKVDTTVASSSAPSIAEDPTSASVTGDMSSIDFVHGDFNFADFNGSYQAPSMNNFAPESSHNFPPLQPNHGLVYRNQVPTAQHGSYSHASAPRATEKRKDEASSAPSRPVSLEEASRVAAEEDKRRRNTAASARFRIKKKQREQALEKSAKEMTDKVTALESKVSQLETENKWLKNLLVDKNGGGEDISSLWKEFTKHASKLSKPDASREER